VATRAEDAARRCGLTLTATTLDSLAALGSRSPSSRQRRAQTQASGGAAAAEGRRVQCGDAAVLRAVLAAAAAPNFMWSTRKSFTAQVRKTLKTHRMDAARTVQLSQVHRSVKTPQQLRAVVEHAMCCKPPQPKKGDDTQAAETVETVVARRPVVKHTVLTGSVGLVEFAADEGEEDVESCTPSSGEGRDGRCHGLTKKSKPCDNKTTAGSNYCWQHVSQDTAEETGRASGGGAGAGVGWGAPLSDVPRGVKVLVSLAEGKNYQLSLPNPFPEVVGAAEEQPPVLAMGAMTFHGELAWKHLTDQADVRVRIVPTALSRSHSPAKRWPLQ